MEIRLSPDVDTEGYVKPLSELVEKFKPQKGLEIGFCWGASAYAYLEATNGTLLSVDINDGKNMEAIFKEVYGERWNIIYGDSRVVLPGITEKFDWIYVDGDHYYNSAITDMRNAWKLLKIGGLMCCDDYGRLQEGDGGVVKAVTEFAREVERPIQVVKNNINGAIYFIK